MHWDMPQVPSLFQSQFSIVDKMLPFPLWRPGVETEGAQNGSWRQASQVNSGGAQEYVRHFTISLAEDGTWYNGNLINSMFPFCQIWQGTMGRFSHLPSRQRALSHLGTDEDG
jgi:hypothetical protein